MTYYISTQLAPPLTEDFYAESYELRKAASTMTPVTIDWFQRQTKALLTSQHPTTTDKTFSVLSVGSGEGDIDIEIIRALSQQLAPQWERLRYVALEPNAAHRHSFLERLETSPVDANVEVIVQEQRFEDLDKEIPTERFNLILFIHVFYYFDAPQHVIPDALQLTKAGGQVVVVHQTPIGIPEIQQQHMAAIKGDIAELFTTADIQRLLANTAVPYRYQQIDAYLDVTKCLHRTEAGLKIISFCMECDLRFLPEAMFVPVWEAFTKLASKRPSGTAFIHEPIGIFTITARQTTGALNKYPADYDSVEHYRKDTRS